MHKFNILAESVRRVATSDSKEWESRAYAISAVTGGIPRVFTSEELLLDNVSVGIHLNFQHHGEVLEVRLGNVAITDMVEWLRGKSQATAIGDTANITRSQFAQILGAILRDRDIQCSTRGVVTQITGGGSDVLRTTGFLLGKRVRKLVRDYFQSSVIPSGQQPNVRM